MSFKDAFESIERKDKIGANEIGLFPERINERQEIVSLPDRLGDLLHESDRLPAKFGDWWPRENGLSNKFGTREAILLSNPRHAEIYQSDVKFLSTYKERIDRTPKDDGSRGEWTDKRGESKFIPNDDDIKRILEKYGLDGIEYKDGIPDFSPCAEATVEIENMTDNRNGPPIEGCNFQQCDQKCAEKWNEQRRDGRSDWTARDVAEWRRENGYSWHERNDMKTCDLIPTKINSYFGHLGGVGEYMRSYQNEVLGGAFDE